MSALFYNVIGYAVAIVVLTISLWIVYAQVCSLFDRYGPRFAGFYSREIITQAEWQQLLMESGKYEPEIISRIMECIFNQSDPSIIGRIRLTDKFDFLMSGSSFCNLKQDIDCLLDDYCNIIDGQLYNQNEEYIVYSFDNFETIQDYIEFLYDFEVKYEVLKTDMERYHNRVD
jgi:hypothetical protein